MKTVTVEVITPERSVYKDTAEYLLVPAAAGPLAVLPGHAPFIGRLSAGVIRIDTKGSSLQVSVGAGIFEVSPEKVTVIADSAEVKRT